MSTMHIVPPIPDQLPIFQSEWRPDRQIDFKWRTLNIEIVKFILYRFKLEIIEIEKSSIYFIERHWIWVSDKVLEERAAVLKQFWH